MSVKSIIAKLLDNQPLNVLERAELEQFDPDKITGELEELRSRAAEAEREKLGEKERLELDIKNISAERDQLKISHDRLLRNQQVRELAGKSRFTDADYLDYLAARENVDLADEQACADFIEKMRQEKPGSFEATLKSGSGSGAVSVSQSTAVTANHDRIGNIISKLENISAATNLQ